MTIESAREYANSCTLITLTDGTTLIVPADPLNMDHVRLQGWIAEGNMVEPE